MWVPMSKDFLRRIVVIVSVMISGTGLSLIYFVRFDVLMLSAAPIAAVALLPRKDWLRVVAFAFLFASVYGVGRIAAEVGRHMLYDLPLTQTEEGYVYALLLHAVYASIWVVWWWRNREADTHNPEQSGTA